MTDSDLERRLERMFGGDADRPVEISAAWREFRRVRGRTSRNRRLTAIGAAAAVAIAAVVAPVVAHSLASGTPSTSVHHKTGGRHHVSRPAPRAPITITARIPQPGAGSAPGDAAIAGAVVSGPAYVWGMTYAQYLFRIDVRSNRVTFRQRISGLRQIAAGGGAIWVLTTAGGRHGEVLKLDPVTGRIMERFALTRSCSDMSYGTQFWLLCGSRAAEFVRLDPATGNVLAVAGPVNGVAQIAATPDGIWYVGNSGIDGYVGTAARLRWIHVNDSAYPVSFTLTDSFLYADGSVWAMTNDESVARIDPATGKITRIYGYQNYDPSSSLGLDFMTVGRGSLWFLELDGRAAVSVLRASIATGQAQASVSGPGTCGEPCFQIYAADGSIWVPTQNFIVRIDPARRERKG